ncbi:tyrosine-protein phosphatase [Bacillus sp. DJP31]|uniref:tyrosine-protein phosphatase n=1 Tax=Bacillus sp. DJP31 TaxID=3409789 RepID=UPI003BB5A069
MIDIHCHILPGMDDGPKEKQGFLEMANAAVQDGISHVFATPHHRNGIYENVKQQILEGVGKANQLLQQEKIPLILLAGQELKIHRDIFWSIEKEEVLTLDNQGNYLLIELLSGKVPSYTLEIVYEILIKGITPIIVHPERNKMFQEDPSLLYELVKMGALTQITAGSILGRFGKNSKSLSEKLIEHRIAHFIATDAHNISSRGFALTKAYDQITSKFGIATTYYLKENSHFLMMGDSLQIEEPIPIRKRSLGFFHLYL